MPRCPSEVPFCAACETTALRSASVAARDVKAKLSRDHELIYPPIQEFWDAAVSGTS